MALIVDNLRFESHLEASFSTTCILHTFGKGYFPCTHGKMFHFSYIKKKYCEVSNDLTSRRHQKERCKKEFIKCSLALGYIECVALTQISRCMYVIKWWHVLETCDIWNKCHEIGKAALRVKHVANEIWCQMLRDYRPWSFQFYWHEKLSRGGPLNMPLFCNTGVHKLFARRATCGEMNICGGHGVSKKMYSLLEFFLV